MTERKPTRLRQVAAGLLFPRGRIAIGNAVLTGTIQAGHMHVEDVLDQGVSYRQIVGVGPDLLPVRLSQFPADTVHVEGDPD